MSDVSEQVEALVRIYGNDFWRAVFALTSPIGWCECGRPGNKFIRVGPLHYGACDHCKTRWFVGMDDDWQVTPEARAQIDADQLRDYSIIAYRSNNSSRPSAFEYLGFLILIQCRESFSVAR